jgi:2-polyprenyl-3-methyl-5-hydroxy-6-metoxy-1,4-benzoquinol methylase
LSFYSALARQCFINEYVFCYTDYEIQKANDLRDLLVAALEAKTQVPVLWLLTVAAYFPLCSLPLAARLLDTQWPEAVTAILLQQIQEPEEELQLRATIPRLTNIENEVSRLVQNQYEENPYPRWVKAEPAGNPITILGFLCQKFPLASFKRHGTSGPTELLIAGCGTGQHSIETAQAFKGARVLAVDLSLSSLSYAKRKTRELGLTSIEYAQADLLELGSLGRSFDIIESVGVLHHMADPFAGWRVLLSLLRPDGFMRLGFYSEVARRNIVQARAFIAERGYGATADEIRQCRQNLMDLDKSKNFGVDFCSISTCRDLLFHSQEHRVPLASIDAFLHDNNVAFLGFDIDGDVLHAYKQRFPNDRPATNLGQWQTFENENPDTFIGMYQFWIQKPG